MSEKNRAFTQGKQQVGQLGEKVVEYWLQARGWKILERRWYCRWGELDLIAQESTGPNDSLLVFIEVKTRSPRNWDENGLLALTQQKQGKLWQAAELFLAEQPHLGEYACRFDLALVTYQKVSGKEGISHPNLPVMLKQPFCLENYQFILSDYIEGVIS